MNNATRAYFDDLVRRSASPTVLVRRPSSAAVANACHANCEEFVAQSEGYEIVRGWLVLNGCWLIPHSVVRDNASGRLVDITPMPSDSCIDTFVEHRGTETEFVTLRQGRDGGWLYPPLEI